MFQSFHNLISVEFNMPSAKRKFVETEKERAKIRKTNHSISSFFGAKERYGLPWKKVLYYGYKTGSNTQEA